MASLIPDVGNVSTNTTGAMQNYLGTVRSTNDALEKPTDILNTHIKNMLDQRRIEEDMALKRSADARAQTELGMQQAERDRINKERSATNEAIQAVVNPNQYGAGKMATEQKAIQQSLANLSPEERVVAEQQIKANYDPMASQKGWLDVAINAPGVDVGRMLDIKNRDYEVKAKTPGTPEYIAAQNAQFDLYKKEQDVTSANRMREIAAQNANAINLFNLQQDAPIKTVDEKGKVHIVKPSELGKPENSGLMLPDSFSSILSKQLEQKKYEDDLELKKQKTALEYKQKVADLLGGSENADAINPTIGAANNVANEYGVSLSDAEVLASISKAKNAGMFDYGKPEYYTDVTRRALAEEISAKTHKPLSEILKKIEGKSELSMMNTAVSNSKGSTNLMMPLPLDYRTTYFGQD